MAQIFLSKDSSFTQKQIYLWYLISKAKLQAGLAIDFHLQPVFIAIVFHLNKKPTPGLQNGCQIGQTAEQPTLP